MNGNIRIEGNRIRLPKIGKVRIRLHREAPQEWKLKSVTVSMEATGEYYVSILYELPESESQAVRAAKQEKKQLKILGIDYAMQGLAVFSDGTDAEYPGYYRKGQEKLRKEQRRLSHCRKGSRNYGKQRKRVAKCHRKIRNQRTDYLHKLSRKSVMDNGFGTFRDMLAYKLEKEGKKLVKVDRFYPSSKRCSCCGAVKKELSLSERIYICPCGNKMDRDVNAAINNREEGRRLLGA